MKGIKTMKKMKKMTKFIALLMSIILIICSLPMTVFAESLENISAEENTDETSENTEDNEKWHLVGEDSIITDEKIGAVSEVESLREENVKHFSLPDGTYEAIIYTEPVHRKDKDGIWQDIDNTIELTTEATVSKYSTKDLRVSFADRFIANSDLFTLSENGYSISMKLLSNGNELDNTIGTTDFGAFFTPTVNNSTQKRTSNVFNSLEEAKSIDNRSSIVYNGIRKNTNIEYVLKGNDVKENIIVTAPCETYEYVFQITLNGLFAELNSNGEISVKDSETSEIKYVIPAPYMYDANGNYSYDVSYALEQVKDEIYLLVINADSEWISAEDRAFPVVIDPTINSTGYVYDTYSDISDTQIIYTSVAYTSNIPDGVYAFQNAAYDTKWMTIEDDYAWDNARLQWETSTVAPIYTATFDKSRLFKITRVGNTARYTIRSMLNNNISFYIYGDKIFTKEIPSDDMEVPIEDTFIINCIGDEFLISPAQNTSYVIGMSTLSNEDLSPVLNTNANITSRWCLKKYIGEEQHGFGLYASDFPLAIGHTGYFTLAVWSTSIGYNTPDLCVHESSTDRLTIDWDDTMRRGIYELLELGTATVSCAIYNDNKINCVKSWEHFINIIPIQPGTYYIQNAQTQKYITSDAYNENQNVEAQNIGAGQWTYDNEDYQRWEIAYTDYSYQYITIRSSEYSGGYLGVDQNDSTRIKQYATVNDYCTWKIELTQKRNFKFTCKAHENSGNVLAISSQYDNGARLRYSKYTHNNYSSHLDFDEWYLVKDVISIVNYHDSTFSNNQLFDYIGEAISFANLVYSRYYNIGIYQDGESTYLSDSDIGKCGNINEKNIPCIKSESACGENCDNHHKNVQNVSDRILDYVSLHGGREINHIYTLWTDSPTKMYCYKDHKMVTAVAMVCQNTIEAKKPMIHFINITDTNYVLSRLVFIMSLTMVHEIAHVLNMNEIYYERDDHTRYGDTVCTMSELDVGTVSEYCSDIRNNNNRTTGDFNENNKYNIYPFCKYCKTLMEKNTAKIDIQ